MLTLGIDIGTSKVAVVLVSPDGVPSHTVIEPTNAQIQNLDRHGAEQSVEQIMLAVDKAIARLPASERAKVSAIGVTGQMHGVLLLEAGQAISNLVTWQDTRASVDNFLSTLQNKTIDPTLRDGYGGVTLAWFAKHQPELLAKATHSATIHDYLVFHMCGLEKPVTDPTNAASWGFYDQLKERWRLDALKLAGVPVALLPTIVPCGSTAGSLHGTWATARGFRGNIPVVAAIGDNQASIIATITDPLGDIALTIGTGGQLSAVITNKRDIPSVMPPSVEIRPFLDGSVLAVAASLGGGQTLKAFVKAIQGIVRDCSGQDVPLDAIFERFDQAGQTVTRSPLSVEAHIFGERYDTSLRGSIRGIDGDNLTLANIAKALASGLVRGFRQMMPEQILKGRKRIVGSGNGIRRLKIVQLAIETEFGLPLIIQQEREEAAIGAAILARRGIL